MCAQTRSKWGGSAGNREYSSTRQRGHEGNAVRRRTKKRADFEFVIVSPARRNGRIRLDGFVVDASPNANSNLKKNKPTNAFP
jgi:hypothetical protein